MLTISGSVFENSAFWRGKYSAFLSETSALFMRLDVSEEMTGDDMPGGSVLLERGSLKIVHDPQTGRTLLKYGNYAFLAEKQFSQIYISASHLRHLKEGISYNRVNEGIHQLARFRALFLDMLVLHASAVVYNEEVLLFSGLSGAGKSTQANLWIDHMGAWPLNFDKPIVRAEEGRVMVSGTPWGGKEDLAVNEVRPAKALFFVHQARENRIERLSAGQAYSRMYLNYFVHPLNKDIEERYSRALVGVIERIPVYDLYCTADRSAAEAVRKELYGSGRI